MFRNGEYVDKVYCTSKDGKVVNCGPNEAIVKLVHHDAKVVNLSKDGVYKMLTYKFQDGGGNCITPSQLAKLLHQLHQLHDKGIVHSDVRNINIVVSMDGENA